MKANVLTLLLISLAGTATVRADEVTLALKAAYNAYTEKELSTAIEKAREAVKLMEEKSAALLQASILPDKIDRWKGETVQKENLGLLGGGVSLNTKPG